MVKKKSDKMKVYKYKKALKEVIHSIKQENKTIGFVPTMGALHRGHLSLIECAKQQNDFTVVSIFVNPNQFNNSEDLEKYPRTLTEDLILLNELNCDIVFSPPPEEIYPEPDKREFDFGHLEIVMEGKFRPGHFNGVAQVVTRLFDIVEPDKAYFGEKDFQQLAVIKKLVKDYNYPLEIVSCQTVRDIDGLALSSRNKRLTPSQRKSAVLIPNTLKKIKDFANDFSVEETQRLIAGKINEDPNLQTEYFQIVDADTLIPVKEWDDSDNLVACIAVYAGDVRLIDNIRL